MRRKRDERDVSFQRRSIRSSPLPMGDQEFETQRGFLHKDPNNGSQDTFFSPSHSLALCFYTFSLALPLQLSSPGKQEEEEE